MSLLGREWRSVLHGAERVHLELGGFFSSLQAHLTPAGVAALFVLAGACVAYALASVFVAVLYHDLRVAKGGVSSAQIAAGFD